MENLTQRDADIAIRHVRPDQPDLIARHLGDFRANLYARLGLPRPRGPPADARATLPTTISSATPIPNA
jgi:DNA-binding transcriptional LysR family regulator